MSKATIEEELAAIKALRTAADTLERDALILRLLPFLRHANNLIVARAADLARDLELREALPDLLASYPRFFENAVKKDPQCWAKNALSKAMHHLGCTESELFLRGLRMHQYEPVWGGQSDVAGTLRANCAHALVDCHDLTHQALLLHLLEVVADADKAVRAEAVRAVTAAGGDSGVLLLRTLAIKGAGEEPEVMGHCYAGLLALEGTAAIPFVAQFLSAQDDRSAEAAVALGETRTPEAFQSLLACLRPPQEPENAPGAKPRRRIRAEAMLEPVFASVLLSAIALTRQSGAEETLLALISEESSLAEAAIEAVGSAGYGPDVNRRVADIITRLDNTRLTRVYKDNFRA